jgi:hypothetical protein
MQTVLRGAELAIGKQDAEGGGRFEREAASPATGAVESHAFSRRPNRRGRGRTTDSRSSQGGRADLLR